MTNKIQSSMSIRFQHTEAGLTLVGTSFHYGSLKKETKPTEIRKCKAVDALLDVLLGTKIDPAYALYGSGALTLRDGFRDDRYASWRKSLFGEAICDSGYLLEIARTNPTTACLDKNFLDPEEIQVWVDDELLTLSEQLLPVAKELGMCTSLWNRKVSPLVQLIIKLNDHHLSDFTEEKKLRLSELIARLVDEYPIFKEMIEGCVELTVLMSKDRAEQLIDAVVAGELEEEFGKVFAWIDLDTPDRPTSSEFRRAYGRCRSTMEKVPVLRAHWKAVMAEGGIAIFKDRLDNSSLDFAASILEAILNDDILRERAKSITKVTFCGTAGIQRWSATGTELTFYPGEDERLGRMFAQEMLSAIDGLPFFNPTPTRAIFVSKTQLETRYLVGDNIDIVVGGCEPRCAWHKSYLRKFIDRRILRIAMYDRLWRLHVDATLPALPFSMLLTIGGLPKSDELQKPCVGEDVGFKLISTQPLWDVTERISPIVFDLIADSICDCGNGYSDKGETTLHSWNSRDWPKPSPLSDSSSGITSYISKQQNTASKGLNGVALQESSLSSHGSVGVVTISTYNGSCVGAETHSSMGSVGYYAPISLLNFLNFIASVGTSVADAWTLDFREQSLTEIDSWRFTTVTYDSTGHVTSVNDSGESTSTSQIWAYDAKLTLTERFNPTMHLDFHSLGCACFAVSLIEDQSAINKDGPFEWGIYAYDAFGNQLTTSTYDSTGRFAAKIDHPWVEKTDQCDIDGKVLMTSTQILLGPYDPTDQPTLMTSISLDDSFCDIVILRGKPKQIGHITDGFCYHYEIDAGRSNLSLPADHRNINFAMNTFGNVSPHIAYSEDTKIVSIASSGYIHTPNANTNRKDAFANSYVSNSLDPTYWIAGFDFEQHLDLWLDIDIYRCRSQSILVSSGFHHLPTELQNYTVQVPTVGNETQNYTVQVPYTVEVPYRVCIPVHTEEDCVGMKCGLSIGRYMFFGQLVDVDNWPDTLPTTSDIVAVLFKDQRIVGSIRRVELKSETIYALRLSRNCHSISEKEAGEIELQWNLRMLEAKKIVDRYGTIWTIGDTLTRPHELAMADYLFRLSNRKIAPVFRWK